jgi:hypothetical protein
MRNPNFAQRIAVVSGAVLLMVAVLFPPVIGLGQMKGYAFLFLASSIHGAIYFPLLLTELGLITILTLAAFFLLKGDGTTAASKRGVISRARERIKASASAFVRRWRGVTRTSAGVAVMWAVVAMLVASLFLFPPSRAYDAEATRIAAIQSLRERLRERLLEREATENSPQRQGGLDFETAVRLRMIMLEDSLKADSLRMTMAKFDSVFDESLSSRLGDIIDERGGVSEFLDSSQYVFKLSHRPVWLSDSRDILVERIAFETAALLLAGLAVSLLLSSRRSARKVRTVWSIGVMLLGALCMFPPMRVYDSEATSRIVESRKVHKLQALKKFMQENDDDLKNVLVEQHVRQLIKARPLSADSAEFAFNVRSAIGERASEIGDSLLKAQGVTVAQSTGQDARKPKVHDREYAAKFLSPSELVYRSAHTPVWTSGQDEIRYHQLALEMFAIVLFAAAATIFLRKKGDN